MYNILIDSSYYIILYFQWLLLIYESDLFLKLKLQTTLILGSCCVCVWEV